MNETKNEILTINAEKISALTGFSREEIAVIKNTIAKGTTDTELAYFLQVCKTVKLNPLVKQIWCYKDGKGNVLTFAGRDGFLQIAQSDTRWNGMSSAYVCSKDEIELDIPSGIVKHKPNLTDRGNVIGAYCIIKPKGCEMPTVVWVDVADYDKGFAVWKSNKGTMIQKVAETHCLKKAFGISGLQAEYDFDVKNEIVIPIAEINNETEIEAMQKKIIDGLEKYKGADKEEIRLMCIEKIKAGEFTETFAKVTAETIGIKL